MRKETKKTENILSWAAAESHTCFTQLELGSLSEDKNTSYWLQRWHTCDSLLMHLALRACHGAAGLLSALWNYRVWTLSCILRNTIVLSVSSVRDKPTELPSPRDATELLLYTHTHTHTHTHPHTHTHTPQTRSLPKSPSRNAKIDASAINAHRSILKWRSFGFVPIEKYQLQSPAWKLEIADHTAIHRIMFVN